MGQTNDELVQYCATDAKIVSMPVSAVTGNKRKLVTIRTIDALEPIEGADVIEVAVIGGWRLVVKRGEFKAGDLCVYFEIDSFLPDGNPAWQFLVDKSSRVMNGVKGHKLRTIKLRGQTSQGLALPINKIELIDMILNGQPEYETLDLLDEGVLLAVENVLALFAAGVDVQSIDFSEVLGIEKYEAPLPAELAGQAAGLFPSFIQKTDQERCQNLKAEIFGYTETVRQASDWVDVNVSLPKDGAFIKGKNAEGKEWTETWDSQEPLGAMTHWAAMAVVPPKASPDDVYEITIKLDGSSMTAFHRDGEVGVCSRNLQLKTDDCNKDNTFVRMFFDGGLNWALPALAPTFGNIAIQGELMGPGIQGNREELKDFKFFVFDVFLIDRSRYAMPMEREDIMKALYDAGVDPSKIDHVPVVDTYVKLGDLGLRTIEDLLRFAEGPSIKHPIREGLVFKRMDGQFSFKAISNLFLTKEKD